MRARFVQIAVIEDSDTGGVIVYALDQSGLLWIRVDGRWSRIEHPHEEE